MCQLALGETRYTEIKIIYLLAMTLCIVTSLHSFCIELNSHVTTVHPLVYLQRSSSPIKIDK